MTQQTPAPLIAEVALTQLGVSDDLITDEEKRQLDDQGYLYLDDVLTAETVERIRARLDALLAVEGDEAGKEVHQEPGTDRLSDLINKDPVFDIVITHPRFLAAIKHVLGPEFHLSSLNFRAPHVGHGHQALHPDWFGPVPDGNFQVCNSMWLIDDVTPDNGPTRLVPGSHRSDHTAADELDGDATRPHPREIKVQGQAGRVVVLNAHTWHGGTKRIGGGPRRVLHGFFINRSHGQQLDQRKYLRPETQVRLSPAQRWVLGVQ